MRNITANRVEKLIYIVRGVKVLLDSDLAELYDVSTKRLNEQVKRNLDRFPKDFAFQITREEHQDLKASSLIFKHTTARRKYMPIVFTEQGIAMLSTVINSKEAIQVNVSIMRAFVKLRYLLASDEALSGRVATIEKKSSEIFRIVFDRLDKLEERIDREVPALSSTRKRIGIS